MVPMCLLFVYPRHRGELCLLYMRSSESLPVLGNDLLGAGTVKSTCIHLLQKQVRSSIISVYWTEEKKTKVEYSKC